MSLDQAVRFGQEHLKDGNIEVVDHILYDTVAFPKELIKSSFPRTIDFFNHQIGQPSKVDTNLVFANKLPNPQAFWVTGFSLMVIDSEIPLSMLLTGAWRFMIGNKVCCSGSPIAEIFSPDGSVRRILTSGLGIVPGINFVSSIYWMTKPKMTAKLQFRLHGHLFRPVS